MDGAEIPVHWARGPEDLRGALHVREQVFIREQGVPRAEEIDGRREILGGRGAGKYVEDDVDGIFVV